MVKLKVSELEKSTFPFVEGIANFYGKGIGAENGGELGPKRSFDTFVVINVSEPNK